MITCYLQGGLGNQLFQIFVALSYAMKYNTECIFTYDNVLYTGVPRQTYWNNLLTNIMHLTTANPQCELTNEFIFETFLCYKEMNFHYTAIPYFGNNNIILYGYFQSYKYFEEYKQLIFSMLNLRIQQSEIIKEYDYFDKTIISETNDIEMQNSHKIPYYVSMHFRYGDYKEKQDFHPVMPLQYYEKALCELCKHIKYNKIIVLYFYEEHDSDIIIPMINILQEKFSDIIFKSIDHNISDWKQLLLMSCCNGNIIANSTFSWWGGYFNLHAGDIDHFVYYPAIWFGPKNNVIVNDLFPPKWKKIDYGN